MRRDGPLGEPGPDPFPSRPRSPGLGGARPLVRRPDGPAGREDRLLFLLDEPPIAIEPAAPAAASPGPTAHVIEDEVASAESLPPAPLYAPDRESRAAAAVLCTAVPERASPIVEVLLAIVGLAARWLGLVR